jgi:hypothetical protein
MKKNLINGNQSKSHDLCIQPPDGAMHELHEHLQFLEGGLLIFKGFFLKQLSDQWWIYAF